MKPHGTNPRAAHAARERHAVVERAERRRLTVEERQWRAVKEIDFQRQIVGPKGIATILGWQHVHFRPAMTKHGWRTAGTGELAQGWPDLTLVRARDRRLIFAELKRELEGPTPAQEEVLSVLHSLSDLAILPLVPGDAMSRHIEVHVWRPSQIDEIARILR